MATSAPHMTVEEALKPHLEEVRFSRELLNLSAEVELKQQKLQFTELHLLYHKEVMDYERSLFTRQTVYSYRQWCSLTGGCKLKYTPNSLPPSEGLDEAAENIRKIREHLEEMRTLLREDEERFWARAFLATRIRQF